MRKFVASSKDSILSDAFRLKGVTFGDALLPGISFLSAHSYQPPGLKLRLKGLMCHPVGRT